MILRISAIGLLVLSAASILPVLHDQDHNHVDSRDCVLCHPDDMFGAIEPSLDGVRTRTETTLDPSNKDRPHHRSCVESGVQRAPPRHS